MPIEIRELIIRTEVTVPGESASSLSHTDKQEIIEECSEQILDRIAEQKER